MDSKYVAPTWRELGALCQQDLCREGAEAKQGAVCSADAESLPGLFVINCVWRFDFINLEAFTG